MTRNLKYQYNVFMVKKGKLKKRNSKVIMNRLNKLID